ncbi:MAG: sigma-70 family RNA polymerase sigma factor [Actinobacteria bacterium]|nr:sigma-70 family RNA polymerase sigma factor [Actinomycetota bacterium]
MDRPRRSIAGLAKGAFRGASPDTTQMLDQRVARDAAEQERRLVEQARQGDESAVEALYRQHYDRVYRYVFYRLGSPTAAEDVSSQVFLAMVRGLPRFEWQGRPFVAWLYAIAQKQVAYHLRRHARADSVDLNEALHLVADTAGPETGAEEREQRVALAQALRQLPDTQREVIILRYVLSLSLAETAAALERSEGAIKQLQLRALAGLRGILAGPTGPFA